MNLVNGIRARIAAERAQDHDAGAVYTPSTSRPYMPNCRYCGQPIDWMSFRAFNGEEKEHPCNPGTFEFHAFTCPNQPNRKAIKTYENPNVVVAPTLDTSGLSRLMTTIKNSILAMQADVQAQERQLAVKRELVTRLQAQLGELELLVDGDSQRHYLR